MADKYLTDSGFPLTTGANATGNETFTGSDTSGNTIRMILTEIGNYIAKIFAPTNWAAPTLTNSWANYLSSEGSGGTVAGYCKSTLTQEVRLKGIIKSGASGSAAFTLPAGFRPSKAFSATGHTYNASTNVATAVEILVGTDGTVTPYGAISTYVALDGIHIPLN